jgi:hypothetical protein
VNDDQPVAVQDEVPLNLRLHRSPAVKVNRTPSIEKVQLLGLIASGVLLLVASKRRGRYVVPAAASLATGSLAALAAVIVSRRRHAAREALIDERVRQSFPASDAPPV